MKTSILQMNCLKYLKSHPTYKDFLGKLVKVMAHIVNYLKLNRKLKLERNWKKWKKKSKKRKLNFNAIGKTKLKEREDKLRKELKK